MQLIVITNEQLLKREHDLLHALFEEGLEVLHIRKPYYTLHELESYVEGINPSYYNRISVHRMPEIIERFPLRGYHFSYDAFKKDNRDLKLINKFRQSNRLVSCSCHSVEDLKAAKEITDYQFISPLFDSISKSGYKAGINLNELSKFLSENNTTIYGLGGIDEHTIPNLQNTGLKGVVVLGMIWKQFAEDSDIKKAVQRFTLLRETLAIRAQ
ncbi:MAG: thiamine phosphate synthase [Sporocytophaga sp.]|uniref:thiamine phosphate synthase n=1 Tax=Sporocytophaga sp. TaxID=2231183 RepID=UPI001B0A38DA|nr:thiamine phosphate synthase [Sporocytophaga sp.]MBO9699998.1 thiamine phosphate synthase [Sporocytophaga sp.]